MGVRDSEEYLENACVSTGKSFGFPASLGRESIVWRLIAVNHFLCIFDEALFFGCQKLNGLTGELLPSWTPVIVLLSLVLLDTVL